MRIAGRLMIATSLALAAAATWVASAGAATFANPAPIAIPSVGAATPYPSQITVAGQTAPISDLNVNLNAFTHDAPGDVRVLLVGPGGQAMLLMACVGNDQTPGASNVNLKLDDSSGILLPAFPSPVFSGTYKPTSYCPSAPSFPSPAPASYANPGPGAGGGATLASIFNNSGANGPWSLFVNDGFSGGDLDAQIAGGWSLEISPDPAPSNAFTSGAIKRNKKKGTATITVNVPNPGELTASGKGVRASSAGGAVISKSVGAGKAKLLIKAKGKKKRKLNETGKVKLNVAITYTPTGGSPNTQSVKVKLKKKL